MASLGSAGGVRERGADFLGVVRGGGLGSGVWVEAVVLDLELGRGGEGAAIARRESSNAAVSALLTLPAAIQTSGISFRVMMVPISFG